MGDDEGHDQRQARELEEELKRLLETPASEPPTTGDLPKMPTPEAVVEDDLQQLEADLAVHQRRVRQATSPVPEPPEWNYEPRKLPPHRDAKADDAMSGLGVGLHVAYTIMGVPLGFAAVGWALDKVLGTTFLLSTLTLAGVVIGLFVAIYSLNRLGNR